MTTAANSLEVMLIALVMLVVGIRQKRLEWRPRDGSWSRKLKPPRTGRRTRT